MVICDYCQREMDSPETKTCDCKFLIYQLPGKEPEVLTRNTTYFDKNERCHDCGIVNKPGNIHHYGCDMERCPKCGHQLISCTCYEEGNLWVTKTPELPKHAR